MIHPHTDRIHPAPFLEVFRTYRKRYARGDVQAGMTVAFFAVPQLIVCGILADVPPIYALYAAVVCSIVTSLWGSARFVNTGPSNSASLLMAAVMLPYLDSGHHLELVFLFTFLVGLIRLTMGLLRLGGLVHFVPESAFLGFTVGVGTLIALGQLHHLLGVDAGSEIWFPAATLDRLSRLPGANLHALAVGGMTLAVMFTFQSRARKVPIALLAMSLGVLYANVIAPGAGLDLVRDIRAVPSSGLPRPISPFFEGWTQYVLDLAPGALAVAVVGLIEAVSIGQTLAVRHRTRVNFNQEFFGQGLGMMAASFFQGIPGSGSFTRSVLLEESGGVTLVANLVYALMLSVALFILPGFINAIPMAALAGLLLYIGIRLIDLKRIKRLYRTSSMDTGVMLATLLVTVLVKIEYGIFTGIVLGALLLLHKNRILHLDEIVPAPDGDFEDRPYTSGSRHEPSAIVALSVQGNLAYSVAHELFEQLNEIVRVQDPEIIIIRIRRALSIDFSSWNAIFNFAEHFQKNGGKVYISDIDDTTRQTIHDARAHDWLPDAQLFVPTDNLMESFQAAMRKAAEEVSDPREISGRWRDWLENPVVVTQDQVRDIQRFLNGESL